MTYHDLDESFAPDDVILIIGTRCIWDGLHVVQECDLAFAKKSGHDVE
jgi:hypothetical protein